MRPDYIFWAAVATFALHVLEEYSYDWKTWAQKIMKLEVDWTTYFVTNVAILFFGLCCAEVGWAHPTFSLIFPAWMVLYAIWFHIIPYVRSKREFSPGMITGIFLFLPIGIGSFDVALNTGVHSNSILIASACGVLLLVFPVFLAKTKNLDFFKP